MNEVGLRRSPSYLLLLTTICVGGVLAPLNSTMLAVALPEIRTDFDVGHAAIGWLVSTYLIAMAVAQPLGGRLGDQLGRAKVFRAGLAAFLVLSVAASFAPTFPLLIVLRTGQALVGASFIPTGRAMLRESVPVTKLGQSMGYTGTAISVAAAVGPLLGAGLLAIGSWRLLFLVNVPLVAVALVFQALLAYQDTVIPKKLSLDWLGAAAFAALLASVTFVLNSLRGVQSGYAFAAGVVAVAAFLALFVYRQRSTSAPIAEWSLFRNRSYTGATAYIMLSNLVMYTTLLSIPFFIEEVQNKGSGEAGILLGAMSLLMAFAAPVGGHISDVWGRRLPTFVGSVILLAGVVAILAALDANIAFGYLAASLSIIGLGIGLSFGAASTAAIEAAPRARAGAAAGTNSMMRYVGSIVGAGVLGAVLSDGAGPPDVDLFRLMFGVLVVMAVLATVSTLFIHRFTAEAKDPEQQGAAAVEG